MYGFFKSDDIFVISLKLIHTFILDSHVPVLNSAVNYLPPTSHLTVNSFSIIQWAYKVMQLLSNFRMLSFFESFSPS